MNKKSCRIITSLFLIIFVNLLYARSSQLLSAEEQNKILKTITENLSAVANLKSEFKQIRYMEVLVEPLVSEGLCYFEKPDKLRWELTEPYQSILIYNDDQVAKFNVHDDKLEKLNLGAKDLMRAILKQIISWMQGDFSEAVNIYNLKIYKSETYKLELIPKSEELIKSIQSIEMVFNEDLKNISTVKINETNNNYITIKFINERKNISLNKQIFDLNQPLLFSKSIR